MLNTDENEIHDRAVRYSKQLQGADSPLLRALTDAHRSKLYLKFSRAGLFRYAVDILKHPEPIAIQYVMVAKKCVQFPEILEAVEAGRFPVAKAMRFVSVVKEENVARFIEHATNLTYRELDFKVAAENPRKRKPSHKPIDADRVRGSYDLTRSCQAKLKRLTVLLKKDYPDVMEQSADFLLDKIDPLRKANRAKVRTSKHSRKQSTEQPPKEVRVDSIPISKRKPIPSATKHAVNRRDGGQCTEVHENGKRCENTKWLHIHHIKAVEDGGTNALSNLTTLCYIHHEIRHQLQFDLGNAVCTRFPEEEKTNDLPKRPPKD